MADKSYRFGIHGDNIVECERAFTLIVQGLGVAPESIRGPESSLCCPTFSLIVPGQTEPFHFRFLPGFERWNEDILAHVQSRGGRLIEAADAIITRIDAEGFEEAILAIEYCGALLAGNQAWQRSGRAYSFGAANIPYFYVAELGGFELGAGRARKAPRLPNPAVPFSFLCMSTTQDTPILPVFIASPGASVATLEAYRDAFVGNDLARMTAAILTSQSLVDLAELRVALTGKLMAVVSRIASSMRNRQSFSADDWTNAHQGAVAGGSLIEYIATRSPPIAWAKKVSIPLTSTMRELMQTAKRLAVGMTSKDLPMCVIPKKSRQDFSKRFVELYPRTSEALQQWLARESHLAIAWVAGFKPRGDDARPDRGLPPMTRMLAGSASDVLTIVYGPAKAEAWRHLEHDPVRLMKDSGFWRAMLEPSDAIFADTTTTIAPLGFVRDHWSKSAPTRVLTRLRVNPIPSKIGENDVDTAIHMLFARLLGESVFEGMCNPPGGDWSGISLLRAERTSECRWLSLPRVSETNAKRPDHVLQLFGVNGCSLPVVLVVESKESAQKVEEQIGPRLKRYLTDLMASTPSIERRLDTLSWVHADKKLLAKNFTFVSAAAFLASSKADEADVLKRGNVEIVLAFAFDERGERCTITAWHSSQAGLQVILHLLSQLPPTHPLVTIRQAK